MMRYAFPSARELSVEFITIEAQAERAVIAPEAGFQCRGYSVGGVDVVAGPKDPEADWKAHPFRSGIPILFPWPGRIADGRFSYGGHDVKLPINDAGHNCAIHGLTYNRVFKVTRKGPYFVAARLDSRTDAELSALWPWPFVLELDYEVGNGLRLHAVVENVGPSTLPFGIGAHPYFHAPLNERGKRTEMQVEGDVDKHWQLDARLLPTSQRLEAPAGRLDVRKPVTLGTDNLDDAYTLASNRGERASRLIDPQMKMAVELRAAPIFKHLVLFAPPAPDVVALEPYTCGPDAFNLAAKGIDGGMLELQPGARFETSFEIRLSAL
jgi:aldose 1-epimerase